MKKSKVIILSTLCALFSSLGLQASNPAINTQELRKELTDLVSDVDLSDMKSLTESVEVEFYLNGEGEIIILDITDSTLRFEIIKNLNHKLIATDKIKVNQLYTVPLVFKRQV